MDGPPFAASHVVLDVDGTLLDLVGAPLAAPRYHDATMPSER